MLILLPGLMCDAAYYAHQTAEFRGSWAVDGYGLRSSLAEMAGCVLDRAPERFDLFGHSMGGRIALEVVRQAPGRVRRLALVSTGVHPLQPGEADKRRELVGIGRDRGFEALIDTWLPPMVAPGRAGDEQLMEPLRAMCRRAGQEVLEAQIAALLGRTEVDEVLAQIACPTLVMTGELDSWSPPEQHALIAQRIANSELVIVPGAGHMITAEAPAAVNAAIAHWLSRPADD